MTSPKSKIEIVIVENSPTFYNHASKQQIRRFSTSYYSYSYHVFFFKVYPTSPTVYRTFTVEMFLFSILLTIYGIQSNHFSPAPVVAQPIKKVCNSSKGLAITEFLLL